MSHREDNTKNEPGDAYRTEAPDRVSAGRGTGLTCAYCHQPIIGEIEYEVLEASAAAGVSGPPPRVHVRCYELWRARQAQGKWPS